MSFAAFLQSFAENNPSARPLVDNLQMPIDTKVDPTAESVSPSTPAGAIPSSAYEAMDNSYPAESPPFTSGVPVDIPPSYQNAPATTQSAPVNAYDMPAYKPASRDDTEASNSST